MRADDKKVSEELRSAEVSIGVKKTAMADRGLYFV